MRQSVRVYGEKSSCHYNVVTFICFFDSIDLNKYWMFIIISPFESIFNWNKCPMHMSYMSNNHKNETYYWSLGKGINQLLHERYDIYVFHHKISNHDRGKEEYCVPEETTLVVFSNFVYSFLRFRKSDAISRADTCLSSCIRRIAIIWRIRILNSYMVLKFLLDTYGSSITREAGKRTSSWILRNRTYDQLKMPAFCAIFS